MGSRPPERVLKVLANSLNAIREMVAQDEAAKLTERHQPLPPEPTLGEAGTTVVTLRIPSLSKNSKRRFHASDLLSDIQHFAENEISTVTSADQFPPCHLRNDGVYPRKMFTTQELGSTLQSLGLWPSCRLSVLLSEELSMEGRKARNKTTEKKPRPSEILSRHQRRFNSP